VMPTLLKIAGVAGCCAHTGNATAAARIAMSAA
jgi:hypothetical protein